MLADIRNVLTNSGQIIITAVTCSFIFFLIGILVGALRHCWATVFTKPCNLKHPNGAHTPTDKPDPIAPAPVIYEEVASDSLSGQIKLLNLRKMLLMDQFRSRQNNLRF